MAPALSRIARLGLLTGGLALVGTGSLLVGSAGAQASPTLSISPETIIVGQSATITATGCVADGVEQEDLFVVLTTEAGGGDESLATDASGTASIETGPAPADAVGTYTVSAQCVFDDGEATEVLFTYEQTPVLTVIAQAPTTSTTSAAPTTTAPAAASPAVVTPAFTG